MVGSLTHLPTSLLHAVGAEADTLFDMKRLARNVIAEMTSVVSFRIGYLYRLKTNGRYDGEDCGAKNLRRGERFSTVRLILWSMPAGDHMWLGQKSAYLLVIFQGV